ncbi:hypothetical protein RGAI101_4107 [Roseobacter sp. GAI101]|nr:hypothetical protein RGAI101_4107 [Roseobacter sp. GAI101]
MRAAGNFWINTVAEPLAMGCGGKFAAGGAISPRHKSVTRAAGILQTNTVTQQGGMIGKGDPNVQGPVCMSATRA